MYSFRWDPCVAHFGDEAEKFVTEYFLREDVKPVLIAGAGFDPRSAIVTKLMKDSKAKLVLIKELRADPDSVQVAQANENAEQFHILFPDCTTLQVAIFGDDNAVVGGRNVVNALDRESLDGVTDVVVDISALSVGTSFPIVRYFLERRGRKPGPDNVHVCVAHDPALDADIRAVASDSPSYIHGFKGGITLEESAGKAKLWLPQLSMGRNAALTRLHRAIEPDDTCPILPFPASDPRIADKLFAAFEDELESVWEVDARNIVYADEADPVDLYRTILRLHDRRKPVFETYGGSQLVLSPLGSKVMALGTLMAALERDLPVAYLEAETYLLGERARKTCMHSHLVHVWLEGRAYPAERQRLHSLDKELL